MPCKMGHIPQEHGRCPSWLGTRGMTSQPTLENICHYCAHWGQE